MYHVKAPIHYPAGPSSAVGSGSSFSGSIPLILSLTTFPLSSYIANTPQNIKRYYNESQNVILMEH
jgi:hypothetical protein